MHTRHRGDLEKKELHRSFRKIDPEKLKAYVADAFRSATGDIRERYPVTTGKRDHVFRCDNLMMADVVDVRECCRRAEELFELYQSNTPLMVNSFYIIDDEKQLGAEGPRAGGEKETL